jgi:hypothetical protein
MVVAYTSGENRHHRQFSFFSKQYSKTTTTTTTIINKTIGSNKLNSFQRIVVASKGVEFFFIIFD